MIINILDKYNCLIINIMLNIKYKIDRRSVNIFSPGFY
jgi:hypothetical protein